MRLQPIFMCLLGQPCFSEDSIEALHLLQKSATHKPDPNVLKIGNKLGNKDPLAEWREPDDEEGGNIAEMRKKIAELPPIAPPKRSEPDDRYSGGFTKETHDLKFENIEKNDIAGAGLVFGGVTTLRGKPVDAVITASNYAAAVPSKTGLKGKMGNINLDSNTEAEFTMKFVDSDTDEAV